MVPPPLILCLEDEPDIRMLLERTLVSLPVAINMTHDATQALAEMAKSRPDLIVTDLQLPGISGWEFLEQVRTRDEWKEIPALVLSVRSAPENRRKGRELKVAKYMTKPFVPRHLQQVVQDLLGISDENSQ